MHRLLAAAALVALAFVFFVPSASAAGISVQMLDRLGASQGTAKVTLASGAVSIKATLPPLPAVVDTGTGTFEAVYYRAYLANSVDAAVELPLGAVWPSSASKAQVKAALKGDLSRLGFDRVVVVAFSKDGQQSFDVLTGTIPTE